MLAVFWFTSDVNHIEPVTVGLGAISALLLGGASFLQHRQDMSAPKQLGDMSQHDLLSLISEY
jgi:hypothetical protein